MNAVENFAKGFVLGGIIGLAYDAVWGFTQERLAFTLVLSIAGGLAFAGLEAWRAKRNGEGN